MFGMIALAAMAASSVGGYVSTSKVADAQKELAKQTQASNVVEARESRIKAARETRIKRAQMLQASESAGVSGSSGSYAASSGLSSQMASQSSRTSYNQMRARNIAATQQAMADAKYEGAMWNTLGGLSSNVFSRTASSMFTD